MWTSLFVLRRGRDSNPRCPKGHNGFRDRPVQPLRHPSSYVNPGKVESLPGDAAMLREPLPQVPQ